jgi:hypothetical protein
MGVRERISASVAEIRSRSQKLVQLNVELLKAEARKKAQEYGGAIGMLVAGALLSLYALGFALATITVALALVLPLWLSLLIVTLVLFLIVAILFLAGRSKLQKLQAAPPAQAAAEAKITAATAKDGARRAAGSLRPTKPPAPETLETSALGTVDTPEPGMVETSAPGTVQMPEPGASPPEAPPTEAGS